MNNTFRVIFMEITEHLLVVVVVLALTHYLMKWRPYLALPAPGFPLPVIGHLHLLMSRESKNDPVNFLWKLWQKHQRHGVMYLRTFKLNLVLVGEFEALKYLYTHPEVQLRMSDTDWAQLMREDRNTKSKKIPGVILRTISSSQ